MNNYLNKEIRRISMIKESISKLSDDELKTLYNELSFDNNYESNEIKSIIEFEQQSRYQTRKR